MKLEIISLFLFFIYHLVTFLNNNKTYICKKCNKKFRLKEKQLAYYTSTKVSFTLLIVGLISNIIFVHQGLNIDAYFEFLQNQSDVIKIVILYFMSYLFFDITVGHIYYKKHIDLLSGYIHHVVYFFISMYALYTNNAPLYILYFIEELPTFILNIGSYNKKYKRNKTFGITFLLARILYHIFLVYHTYKIKIILPFAIMSLGLHIYWWSNWLKKYAFKKETIKRD